MIIAITLTEEEQKLLLSCAGINATVGRESYWRQEWQSIAEKIRRARDGSPWEVPPITEEDGHQRAEAMRLYRQKSTHIRCGICGTPKGLHTSELVAGHKWQASGEPVKPVRDSDEPLG